MSEQVVITGGSRGIGLALAHRMLKRGHRVMLCARSKEEVDHALRELHGLYEPSSVHGDVCDVAKPASVRAFAERTQQYFAGPATVVVNNAGIVLRAAVHEMTTAQWGDVIGVNLTGAFLISQAFLQPMRDAKRGRVIFVSSISGTLGSPRASAYCASKWGLIGLMKSLAEEGRDCNIQSMALLPGSVDTQMLVGSGFSPAMSPDDVAKALEFLCLDAPNAMTGSAVEVFG